MKFYTEDQMVDNVIYILRGEHIYDIQGMMVR